MHSRPHIIYENRTVFVYFLTISGIIHLIFIFLTSGLSHLLRPAHNFSGYTPGDSKYVIEIDLESGPEKGEIVEYEETQEEEAEKESPEDKRPLFVDTSDKAVDEEPQADTNKIGEKGSIARDMYPGEDNINDNPRLQSDTDFPGEAPDELASAIQQESGFPVEAGNRESGREVSEDIPQQLVKEESADNMSEVDGSEESPVSEEVEVSSEMHYKSVDQDMKGVGPEDMSVKTPGVEDKGQINDIDKLTFSTQAPDVVILPSESVEDKETGTEVAEKEADKTAEPVEEYTKTASIPRSMMKEIVEGSRESIADKVQNKFTAPEPSTNNLPAGNGAPFFEDNISNAPVTGEESFNIKKHEYAPYYKHIKDKIRLYWLLQYGTDASINQETRDYKPVIVTFKVLPSGKIDNVIILDSAGNELLASKIQISIQNTVLNKFPEYIVDKYINVKFSYYFF